MHGGGEYGPARTPLHVGIYLIDGTTGQGVPYATATAALAAASSGDIVSLPPYAVAENVVVPDGVTVRLNGTTLGTAGDHSIEINSPAGGESARIVGWGTLEGTGGSIDAAAGAYFELSHEIVIAGAVTGVYRIGRDWHLQSGEAIATYCPADGSVVPVSAGDRLWDGNTGLWLMATLDSGAVMRWASAPVSLCLPDAINAAASAYTTVGAGFSSHPSASGILLVGVDIASYVATTNTGANHWTWQLSYKEVAIGPLVSTGTTPDTPDKYTAHRVTAANAYVDLYDDGEEMASPAYRWGYDTVKVGAPGNLTIVNAGVMLSQVFA